MNSVQSSAAAKSKAIATILADEDVMGLADGNPDPVGEYQVEADAIARELSGSETLEAIAPIVRRVFKHWFEVEIPSEDADRIAKRLAEGSPR